jgi:predicted transcriptional regulator
VIKDMSRIAQEQIEQIYVLYEKMHNKSAVAKELGISVGTVTRYLNQDPQAIKVQQQLANDKKELVDYIILLFHEDISKWNLTQIEKFRKQGITYKQTYQTLKYFYEIRKMPITKKTIGIVPHVIDEARAYWDGQRQKQNDFQEAIEKQNEQEKITVQISPQKRHKKIKKTIDLNEI